MELLRLFLFLLDLLGLRLHILKVRHIKELHPRHVHQTVQIYGTVVHRVKTPLHTVRAYRDIVRQFDHLPGHALRAVTDKADLLVSIVVLLFLLL